MKVLLLYPKYTDTFWSFKYVLKFISKKAAFPPLGLLTVAAMLPESWTKRLIDLNIEPLTDADIAWADMVMVSAMLVQQQSAQEQISRCKRLGKRIVAGGPAFTAQHEKFVDVDHFVLNEAEATLPPFLRDLATGCPQPLYTDTSRPDLAQTPVPLWSLIKGKNYATMAIQFSRGCPYNCEFCDIVIMNGRKPRTKSPAQMCREFDALYASGWRQAVFIVDDNFIGHKAKVKEMLAALIAWQQQHRYPFTLLTEASIDLAADQELMQLMSTANFYKVFLGLETPSPDGLEECGKHQNTGINLVEAVRAIHGHGMQVMGGFIVGFDTDTEKIFDAQIAFIQQIGVVTAMVGVLTALPQTRLWHRLKAEGRLIAGATGENTDGVLNFLPKMDRRQLLEGYEKILATIYSPTCYYQRIHTFLQSYSPTVRKRLQAIDLVAFARSVWQIGIFSRSRFLYWRLLFSTLLRKRRALPFAVELAIFGLHYEKMAQRVAVPGDDGLSAPSH
jgi:radical SAM superfamily enzyme YgiQ (UPF0313 family)